MSSFDFSYRSAFPPLLETSDMKCLLFPHPSPLALSNTSSIMNRRRKKTRPVSTTDLFARRRLLDTFINPTKHLLSNSCLEVSRAIHNCCFECRCIFALVCHCLWRWWIASMTIVYGLLTGEFCHWIYRHNCERISHNPYFSGKCQSKERKKENQDMTH